MERAWIAVATPVMAEQAQWRTAGLFEQRNNLEEADVFCIRGQSITPAGTRLTMDKADGAELGERPGSEGAGNPGMVVSPG